MPRERSQARTDEWTTPPEIVALVLTQWGGLDLDPCSHPLSPATKAATTRYDIREGQDGLALDWPAGARVFCNPPYARGQIKLWAAKCAAHARAGGEALMLIPAAVGSVYWREEIWPHAAQVCFVGRLCFARDGVGETHQSDTESAIVYFGANPDAFAATWRTRGTVVTVAALQGTAGDEGQLQAADDVPPSPRDLAARMVAGLLAQLRIHDGPARIEAAHKAAEAVRVKHGAVSSAYALALQAAHKTVQDVLEGAKEKVRIEALASAFLTALEPSKPLPVRLPYPEHEARRKAARNAAKVSRAERIAAFRDAQEAAQAATDTNFFEPQGGIDAAAALEGAS